MVQSWSTRRRHPARLPHGPVDPFHCRRHPSCSYVRANLRCLGHDVPQRGLAALDVGHAAGRSAKGRCSTRVPMLMAPAKRSRSSNVFPMTGPAASPSAAESLGVPARQSRGGLGWHQAMSLANEDRVVWSARFNRRRGDEILSIPSGGPVVRSPSRELPSGEPVSPPPWAVSS